jgi:glutaredoxin
MQYAIVGRSNCSFCDKAKELLEEHGHVYTYYSIEDNKWVIDLFRRSAINTVPQVWLDDKYIGGYTELKGSLKNAT